MDADVAYLILTLFFVFFFFFQKKAAGRRVPLPSEMCRVSRAAAPMATLIIIHIAFPRAASHSKSFLISSAIFDGTLMLNFGLFP
jgi:hypothetical protein